MPTETNPADRPLPRDVRISRSRVAPGGTPRLRVLLPALTEAIERQGDYSVGPALHSPRKRRRRLPPEVLTDEEVFALMQACGRYTPTGNPADVDSRPQVPAVYAHKSRVIGTCFAGIPEPSMLSIASQLIPDSV